ncbi:condensation domain-containing protein, partial [Streptomyces huiliensis]|uniref:condensation domain-containing protein n=1 Tax=Streptomyces huiliensis TaxID=2876027 RepID=UPI001CBDEE1A
MLGDPADPTSRASRQLSFWKGALQGIPDEMGLPFDRPRPAVASYRGGTVDLFVEAGAHGGLAELARRRGVTTFMVFQAALAVLLAKISGGTDIPVG